MVWNEKRMASSAGERTMFLPLQVQDDQREHLRTQEADEHQGQSFDTPAHHTHLLHTPSSHLVMFRIVEASGQVEVGTLATCYLTQLTSEWARLVQNCFTRSFDG